MDKERAKLLNHYHDKIGKRKAKKKSGLSCEEYDRCRQLIVGKYISDVQTAAKEALNKEFSGADVMLFRTDVDILEYSGWVSKRPEFPDGNSLDPVQRVRIVTEQSRLISFNELVNRTLRRTELFFKQIEDNDDKLIESNEYVNAKFNFYMIPHYLKRNFFVSVYGQSVNSDLVKQFIDFVNKNKCHRRTTI